MSSACLQPTPKIRAASAASAARSSAEPRVPASPCVRSRIAVRQPRAFILSSVPPQVCSTSSRCAAMARISAIEFSGMISATRQHARTIILLKLLYHRFKADGRYIEDHYYLRPYDSGDVGSSGMLVSMLSRMAVIVLFFAGSLFALPATNLFSQTNPEWVESFPPHRIIGNIYY